jgi:hypothetical protein
VRIASGGDTSTVVAMKRSRRLGEARQVERRLRQDASTFSRRTMSRTASRTRVAARRHDVEAVAEVPPDRLRRHVGPDDPYAALPVHAKRAQVSRRPGSAGRRDENRDVAHQKRRCY